MCLTCLCVFGNVQIYLSDCDIEGQTALLTPELHFSCLCLIELLFTRTFLSHRLNTAPQETSLCELSVSLFRANLSPPYPLPQVSCQEWGQVLLRNKEWEAVLEHSLMAWRYTSELPQWDTVNHNALREQCYSILAAQSLTALQHYRPEPSRGLELLKR